MSSGPSRMESGYVAFGLSAVECHAAQVPVIGSRIGVMTGIVHDGEIAAVVERA